MSRVIFLYLLKWGKAMIPTWQFTPRSTPCESTFAGAVSHAWRAGLGDAQATPRL
jgi:hypothetical protein